MYFNVDMTLSYYSTTSMEAQKQCQFPSAKETWAKEIFKEKIEPTNDWSGHIVGKSVTVKVHCDNFNPNDKRSPKMRCANKLLIHGQKSKY